MSIAVILGIIILLSAIVFALKDDVDNNNRSRKPYLKDNRTNATTSTIILNYTTSTILFQNVSSSTSTSIESTSTTEETTTSITEVNETVENSSSTTTTINFTSLRKADLPFTTQSGPSSSSGSVGYEYLDDGKVIHFWNENDDYYLNASSGLQFTNNYQDYWTRNIFCGGARLQQGWKYYCNDALRFNGTISSDNATYFNITWSRNVTQGNYKIAFRLTYHLGSGDLNLTVNPSIENIGNNTINADLGFAWKITDIKIGSSQDDFAYINNSFYELSNSYNILFNNLSYIESNLDENNNTFLFKKHFPHYKIYDDLTGKYLTLDWDKNLKYNLTMKSEPGQDNAPITLAINIGRLAKGEKKSIFFYWIDAGNQFARPDDDLNNPDSWNTMPTAGQPLYSQIDETSYNDTDYLYSQPHFSVNTAANISFSSLNDPDNHTNHIFRYRHRKSGFGGMQVDVEVKLFQGNELVKTDSTTNIGSTFNTRTITLTSSEAALITDYSNLTMQFRKKGNLVFPTRNLQISWVELEVPEVPVQSILIYDKNGNLVRGLGRYYEYNNFNQLKRVRLNNINGQLLSVYFYDHEGNRIKKVDVNSTHGNTTTYYINKNFIRIVNSTGVYNETYYYHDDTLIARKDSNGNRFYYHPDHLGSTNMVTNQNGNAIENTTYYPYGGTFTGGNSRFLFTGKERDDNSLYYYGARYYSPDALRRFIQPDQNIQDIYNPQDLNHYAYVRNNPYKYVDPDGNDVEQVNVGEFTLASPAFTLSLSALQLTVAIPDYDPDVSELTLASSYSTGPPGFNAFVGGPFSFSYSTGPDTANELRGSSTNEFSIQGGYGPSGGYSISNPQEGKPSETLSVKPGVGLSVSTKGESSTFVLPYSLLIFKSTPNKEKLSKYDIKGGFDKVYLAKNKKDKENQRESTFKELVKSFFEKPNKESIKDKK